MTAKMVTSVSMVTLVTIVTRGRGILRHDIVTYQETSSTQESLSPDNSDVTGAVREG
jgi:hypothetical protein